MGWGEDDVNIPFIISTNIGKATTDITAKVSGQTLRAYTMNNSFNGQVDISGYIDITTFSVGSVNLTVDYTDENGAVHTGDIIPLASAAGAVGTPATAAGFFKAMKVRINVLANTTITVKTAGTFTSLTYNAGCSIEQVNNQAYGVN